MTKELTEKASKHNVISLLWHASFLALARNFIDFDTVMPALLIESGGTAVGVGILTAIMLGGAGFTQILFSPYLNNKPFKKKYLLIGINARVVSLAGMALLLYYATAIPGAALIAFIFLIIAAFSLSGAFANISYTDILGKSILSESRKRFLSMRQVITGICFLLSAVSARTLLSEYAYPTNYFFLFVIATVMLALASLGFWNIDERLSSGFSIRSLKHYADAVREELVRNRRMKYYLGFVNTLGISVSILPFLVLFSKENYGTGSHEIGNYLLFKVSGSVFAGIILFLSSERIRYRYLMYLVSAFSIFIPVYVMTVSVVSLFSFPFLLGGVVFTCYTISVNGVLLEISDNRNRALYTGIAGAGNIVPTLFPLLGGWIIHQYGFEAFFVVFVAVILSSIYFIYRIDCRR